MKKATVIITGASGYLGANYCASLANHNKFAPIPLVRKVPAYLQDWITQFPTILQADITDQDALDKAFGSLSTPPQAIVHFASVDENICAQDVVRAIEVNGLGAQRAFEAAAQNNIPVFVLISTFHVYGTPAIKHITENTPAYPVHNYGITKLLGEMLCQNSAHHFPQTKLIILRLSNGFGPPLRSEINRWTLVVNDLCRQTITQHKLILKTAGNQRRDFICLEDIFQAVNLMLGDRAIDINDNVFNVGSGTTMSILEIAQKIQVLYEQNYHQAISLEIIDATPQKSLLSFEFDFSKIAKLGYKPRGNFDENILKTLEVAQCFSSTKQSP